MVDIALKPKTYNNLSMNEWIQSKSSFTLTQLMNIINDFQTIVATGKMY